MRRVALQRYEIVIERYSLAPGHVGEVTARFLYSTHRSLAAAGRRLATHIGKPPKRAREESYRFYVQDHVTGLRYTRNGCKTGTPLT